VDTDVHAAIGTRKRNAEFPDFPDRIAPFDGLSEIAEAFIMRLDVFRPKHAIMTLRFIQLSDIHFGQERDGSLPEHEDVRHRLIADAAELAGMRGAASMVLVVGDTAFSGKQHEYERAGKWLDAVTMAVGCKEKSVRLVPGNHDCDREKVSEVCRMVHEKIRSGTPKSAYGHMEKIAKYPEGQNPLLAKLQAYRDFAAGYESDFQSISSPLWTTEFDFPEGVTLRLIGMNAG
jgi:hypothetical protein